MDISLYVRHDDSYISKFKLAMSNYWLTPSSQKRIFFYYISTIISVPKVSINYTTIYYEILGRINL